MRGTLRRARFWLPLLALCAAVVLTTAAQATTTKVRFTSVLVPNSDPQKGPMTATFTSAKFTFSTNVPTTAMVSTGTDTKYMLPKPDRMKIKHVVTVLGLMPNTTYYALIAATDKSGKTVRSMVKFQTAAPGSMPATVTSRGNKLFLNGQPWLPIMVQNFDPCPATGLDLFAGLRASVVSTQDNGSSACSGQDSASWASSLDEILKGKFWWNEADPTARQQLVVGGLKELLSWQAKTTLVGTSTKGSYLDPSQCFMASPEVFYMTSVAAKKGFPTLRSQPLVEHPFIGHPATKTCVNATNLPMALWSFVAAQGSAVLFSAQSSPVSNYDAGADLLGPAATFAKRLASLGPALLSGKRVFVNTNSDAVQAGAWKYGGATFVIAVNTSNVTTSATISAPSADKARTALLMWNGRHVAAKSGTVTKSFGPQEVDFIQIK